MKKLTVSLALTAIVLGGCGKPSAQDAILNDVQVISKYTVNNVVYHSASTEKVNYVIFKVDEGQELKLEVRYQHIWDIFIPGRVYNIKYNTVKNNVWAIEYIE